LTEWDLNKDKKRDKSFSRVQKTIKIKELSLFFLGLVVYQLEIKTRIRYKKE
jgi:hypothetical protein